MSFLFCCTISGISLYNIQGSHHRLCLLGFYSNRQTNQFLHVLDITQWYQNSILYLLAIHAFILCELGQRYFLRPFLRGKRSDDTSHQNHHDRTVQHTFIQQTDRFPLRGCPQDHVISHQNGRQCRGSLRITQPENQGPFGRGKTEILLNQPSRNKFRNRCHNCHNNSHPDRRQIIQEHLKVNQHPDPDQKKGNKQRVPDKFDPVHQCRSIRY